jgi:hypothetical protein
VIDEFATVNLKITTCGPMTVGPLGTEVARK